MLKQTIEAIVPIDLSIAAETQALLDAKTKPHGSLGRLEELACNLAAMRGQVVPEKLRKTLVIMGADHGVVAEQVSAYPQDVTGQMILNFSRGGAAINVLAQQMGCEVRVVNMGTVAALPENSHIINARIGPGTRNFAREPAMTDDEALRAVESGIRIVTALIDRGATLIGLGEMGIGNTTSAAALAAAFTGAPGEALVGLGTGVNEATWARKVAVVDQAIALHRPCRHNALDAMAKVGGFEINGLAGVVLGAAARRVPVVVDGYCSGVAALAAIRLAPQTAGYLITSHRSAEAGSDIVLQAIGVKPLFDLNLRLGEGSGAALAMPFIDAALAILHDMHTFTSAGVAAAKAGA